MATYNVYNATVSGGVVTVGSATGVTNVTVTDTSVPADGGFLDDRGVAGTVTIPGINGGAPVTLVGVYNDNITFNDAFIVTNGTSDWIVTSHAQALPSSGDTGNVVAPNASDFTTWFNLATGNAGCFVTGTMIATPSGQVPVETLKAGDLVLTQSGAAAPVRWLGHTRVSRLFGDASRVLPVRIMAGALSENVPSRDLGLSPNHAVAVDGLLIQAGALVNGTTIVRDTNADLMFTYYHVELENHDVLLAEGAAVESYLDVVEDMAFANVADRPARTEAMQELPMARVKAARQVPEAIRAAISARAAVVLGDMAVAA